LELTLDEILSTSSSSSWAVKPDIGGDHRRRGGETMKSWCGRRKRAKEKRIFSLWNSFFSKIGTKNEQI
jgi:hypothetical protein